MLLSKVTYTLVKKTLNTFFLKKYMQFQNAKCVNQRSTQLRSNANAKQRREKNTFLIVYMFRFAANNKHVFIVVDQALIQEVCVMAQKVCC